MPRPKINRPKRSPEIEKQKALFKAELEAKKTADAKYQEWRYSDGERQAQEKATTEFVARILESLVVQTKLDPDSVPIVAGNFTGFVHQYCGRPRVPMSIFHPGEPGWEIDDCIYNTVYY
jgi:hypothetical protein